VNRAAGPHRAGGTVAVYTDDLYILAAMTEPTFLILTALAGEARHGYAVMEDVHRISDGRVKLRAGTLYAALDRLRSEGLISVDREEVVDSRLRRYYRLTALGAERLATETERMRRHASEAARRLRRNRAAFEGGAPA
jgi:DNA-binding PadR family transcriptional regulator